ncbi:MAG: hypothetical protein ICV68_14760 [Pyrinomonadaceae bacterium]|nr:hypothetical protein [Pyrinomonadaceae bacterium]
MLQATTRLIIVSCLVVLAALAVSAQDFAIKPGRSIGKIELGMSRRAVHNALGQPGGSYRMSGRLTGEYWAANTGNDVRIVYRAGRVIQIKITSPSFTTPEGLTTASSLADVRRSYSRLRKTRHFVRNGGGGLIDYYDAIREGISFEFVSLTFESQDFKPYAIIVHQPGRRVIPENGEDLVGN